MNVLSLRSMYKATDSSSMRFFDYARFYHSSAYYPLSYQIHLLLVVSFSRSLPWVGDVLLEVPDYSTSVLLSSHYPTFRQALSTSLYFVFYAIPSWFVREFLMYLP